MKVVYFMYTVYAVLDERFKPVWIGRYGCELGQGDTSSKGVLKESSAICLVDSRIAHIGCAGTIFVSDVNVLNPNLDIVDDLGDDRSNVGLLGCVQ